MAHEAESELGTESSHDALMKLSIKELFMLGRNVYGLNMSNGTSKKDLVDLIINAGQRNKGNAEMQVVSEDEDVEVPKGYVKIRVSPGQYNPKSRPIIVGLNFRQASIPVNRDVVMPGKWLTCLQDAVEDKASIGIDDDGKETLIFTSQHKYPYSILVDNR